MEVPSGVCLLVADWGIGDHYIVGSFADAVRRQSNLRVWLGGRPNLAFIGELYPAIERYVEWPAGRDAQQLSGWKVESGKVFYAHFPKMELMRAVGYNGFHFLDAYRCRLGLPAQAQPTRPRPPSASELAAASAQLRAQGCTPGNTVILSIEARTTPTEGIDAGFWTALAGELEAAGFTTAVNAGPLTNIPPGLKPLQASLDLFRALVHSAGFFCSVRSGLSDLVCDVRCPQVVVYPDVRYWAGSLHEGTTFARYGLTKTPHEVIVRPGYSRADVMAVAEYFVARKPRTALVGAE